MSRGCWCCKLSAKDVEMAEMLHLFTCSLACTVEKAGAASLLKTVSRRRRCNLHQGQSRKRSISRWLSLWKTISIGLKLRGDDLKKLKHLPLWFGINRVGIVSLLRCRHCKGRWNSEFVSSAQNDSVFMPINLTWYEPEVEIQSIFQRKPFQMTATKKPQAQKLWGSDNALSTDTLHCNETISMMEGALVWTFRTVHCQSNGICCHVIAWRFAFHHVISKRLLATYLNIKLLTHCIKSGRLNHTVFSRQSALWFGTLFLVKVSTAKLAVGGDAWNVVVVTLSQQLFVHRTTRKIAVEWKGEMQWNA